MPPNTRYQIIPQLRDNLTRSNTITIPTTCPVCGGKTKVAKDNDSEILICTNSDCPGKLLRKLKSAAGKVALNIDGFSEATIQKFISLGWLNSIRDIYHLSEYKTEMYKLEGFGKKSVDKLLNAIEDSRNITFDRFLCAQSIPLIGNTVSKQLSKFCDDDFNVFVKYMTEKGASAFSSIDGIGDEMVKSLSNWWNDNSLEFVDFGIEEMSFIKKESTQTFGANLTGKVFVITGSLSHFKNRDEMKEKIESLGGKVSGSISAKTEALINNDIESTSSKNKKAKSLNIPIISEEEFTTKYLQ